MPNIHIDLFEYLWILKWQRFFLFLKCIKIDVYIIFSYSYLFLLSTILIFSSYIKAVNKVNIMNLTYKGFVFIMEQPIAWIRIWLLQTQLNWKIWFLYTKHYFVTFLRKFFNIFSFILSKADVVCLSVSQSVTLFVRRLN